MSSTSMRLPSLSTCGRSSRSFSDICCLSTAGTSSRSAATRCIAAMTCQQFYPRHVCFLSLDTQRAYGAYLVLQIVVLRVDVMLPVQKWAHHFRKTEIQRKTFRACGKVQMINILTVAPYPRFLNFDPSAEPESRSVCLKRKAKNL